MAAEEPTARYALILEEPAATRAAGRKSVRTATLDSHRELVRNAQIALRNDLASRNVRVTGASQTLLNAVFVEAPPSRLAELRAMSGVKYVAPLHKFRLHLNRAVVLENAQAAWTAVNGVSNAGAGIKIGIIDTGIDQNHPAFQDSSLKAPAGFPKCTDGAPGDCSFTNNKVIVARSYVRALASGALSGGAANSRPDDITPRDHFGHGTAQGMITAGMTNTGPTGITITGFAPKAWLGNYRVFGSPGLNDYTGGDVLIQAIEDALHDGMNIAVMALGSPALTGPLDTGSACGEPAGTPCDPEAQAVEAAVQAGMLVVASAGNSGDSGQVTPDLGTLETPATAPSALGVAASTNSHRFVNSVHVLGANVPDSLANIPAMFGDGPAPATAVTAPLVDVMKFDSTGLACSALPSGSLNGAFALITRGQCNFSDKAYSAQQAGAAGVIFILASGDDGLFTPGGSGVREHPGGAHRQHGRRRHAELSSPRTPARKEVSIRVSPRWMLSGLMRWLRSLRAGRRFNICSSPKLPAWARMSIWPRRSTIPTGRCTIRPATRLLRARAFRRRWRWERPRWLSRSIRLSRRSI